MSDLIKIGIGVAVALVVAAAVTDHCYDGRLKAWEDRVERIEQFAEIQVEAAQRERARADSAEAVAAGLAEEAEAREPEIRERIVEIEAQPVPEEALEFTEPRDSVIALLQEQVATWRGAYEHQKRAADRLRAGFSRLEQVNDSLRSVLSDRPSPKPAWLPSFEVGAFGGICMDGRPCAGVGAGLMWKIKIPIGL